MALFPQGHPLKQQTFFQPIKPNMEQEQPTVAAQPTFEHADKKGKKTKYKVLGTKWQIPGIGLLTAADIAENEAAQQYLVDANAIGSVIEKVA